MQRYLVTVDGASLIVPARDFAHLAAIVLDQFASDVEVQSIVRMPSDALELTTDDVEHLAEGVE